MEVSMKSKENNEVQNMYFLTVYDKHMLKLLFFKKKI